MHAGTVAGALSGTPVPLDRCSLCPSGPAPGLGRREASPLPTGLRRAALVALPPSAGPWSVLPGPSRGLRSAPGTSAWSRVWPGTGDLPGGCPGAWPCLEPPHTSCSSREERPSPRTANECQAPRRHCCMAGRGGELGCVHVLSPGPERSWDGGRPPSSEELPHPGMSLPALPGQCPAQPGASPRVSSAGACCHLLSRHPVWGLAVAGGTVGPPSVLRGQLQSWSPPAPCQQPGPQMQHQNCLQVVPVVPGAELPHEALPCCPLLLSRPVGTQGPMCSPREGRAALSTNWGAGGDSGPSCRPFRSPEKSPVSCLLPGEQARAHGHGRSPRAESRASERRQA